jgi:hypothetical protein
VIPLLAVVPATELMFQRFYPVIAERVISVAVESLGPYPRITQNDADKYSGNVFSRGLFIIAFTDCSEWDKTMHALAERSVSTVLVNQTPAMVYKIPAMPNPCNDTLSCPDINMYVCSPRPGVLLISTDLEEITEVIDRIRKNARRQDALPRHLPEWSYVDESAQFWALRHYRHDPADPTEADYFVNQDVLQHKDDVRLRERRVPTNSIGIVIGFTKMNGEVTITYLSANDEPTMLSQIAKCWGCPIQLRSSEMHVEVGTLSTKSLTGYPALFFWLLGHLVSGT